MFRNIKCLVGKHDLPVRTISGVICSQQTVKCTRCNRTIYIGFGDVKIVKF